MDSVTALAVVIPWRDAGDEDRQRAMAFVTGYYRRLELGPVIVTDDGRTSGQFNRHAAYNRGLALADDAEVILWNEADTIVPRKQIEQAVEAALEAPGIVIPYSERHELNAFATKRVYAGHDPFDKEGSIVFANGSSIGQAGVTSRATIDAIGGKWDEGYAGWGYDDNAAFHAFATLAGPPRWITGKGVHLWHKPAFVDPSPEAAAATERNRARFELQRQMTPEELRAHLRG